MVAPTSRFWEQWVCYVCNQTLTSDRYFLVTESEGFAVPVHTHCRSSDHRLAGVPNPVRPDLISDISEEEHSRIREIVHSLSPSVLFASKSAH